MAFVSRGSSQILPCPALEEMKQASDQLIQFKQESKPDNYEDFSIMQKILKDVSQRTLGPEPVQAVKVLDISEPVGIGGLGADAGNKDKINITTTPNRSNSCHPLQCAVCGKTFKTDELLQSHITKSRHKIGSHVCKICNLDFYCKYKLDYHRSKYHSKHQCNICYRNFPSPFKLKEHYRTHTGEKPLQCDVCHESFKHNRSLRRHEKSHGGHEKPPIKTEFDFQTLWNPNHDVRQDLVIHTEQRKLICKFCDHRFMVLSNFEKHMKTRVCRVCNEKFGCCETLKRHTDSHKGK